MKKIVYSILSVGLIIPVSIFAYNPPANTDLPEGSVTGIVSNIMTWILGLVGFLGVIGFAISGILYLTAAGDEDRITTAKRKDKVKNRIEVKLGMFADLRLNNEPGTIKQV